MVGYEVQIGSSIASSRAGAGSLVLLALRSELSMSGAGGQATIELAAAERMPLATGDAVRISLRSDLGAAVVFTGALRQTRLSPSIVQVVASDGLSRLASRSFVGAYEQTSAGRIIKDLLGELAAGQIDSGPQFPSYFLHPGPSTLQHLRRLCEESGFELYTDGNGQVHARAPQPAVSGPRFPYSQQVLALELREVASTHDGVLLFGESAASTKGSERAHVLSTDLSQVKGQAAVGADGRVQPGTSGQAMQLVSDGAIRTGSEAAAAARAQATVLAGGRLRGVLTVAGCPQVQPGDSVQVTELPSGHAAAGLLRDSWLRVRGVRHLLNREHGYTSRLEF